MSVVTILVLWTFVLSAVCLFLSITAYVLWQKLDELEWGIESPSSLRIDPDTNLRVISHAGQLSIISDDLLQTRMDVDETATNLVNLSTRVALLGEALGYKWNGSGWEKTNA